jgi:hypothetical protein
MNEQSLIQLTVEIERIKDILYPYDATDLGAHLLVPPKMANHLFELKRYVRGPFIKLSTSNSRIARSIDFLQNGISRPERLASLDA